MTQEELKEKVEQVYNRWQRHKETAEQHEFVTIYMRDNLIERAYNDLQTNWSDEHAEIFIRGIERIL